MPRPTLPLFIILATAATQAAAQQAPHDSVQGAVRAVDQRARTIEVTTGVGLALRAVRLRVPATTQITAAGATLPFTALKPGDIVRVTFGARPEGYVAYTIEWIGDMATGRGGGRSP